MTNIASFYVDKEKCIGCGLCEKVCPGGILHLNAERKCEMEDIDGFGWNGCWKCEHCLAVCPKGAITIFGKKPEDSIPPVKAEIAEQVMDAIIMNRHYFTFVSASMMNSIERSLIHSGVRGAVFFSAFCGYNKLNSILSLLGTFADEIVSRKSDRVNMRF